jgi:hypothetical protein
MREGALFGAMFGLGVAAVAIGVTVSRVLVGPAPVHEEAASAPIPAAPALEAPQPPAPVASPANVPAAAAPPAAVKPPRTRDAAVRPPKARRPAAVDPAAPPNASNASGSDDGPVAAIPSGASTPADKLVVAAPPSASAPAENPVAAAPSPAEREGRPVAIVRSGAAVPGMPGSGRRPAGARIIQLDPPADGR